MERRSLPKFEKRFNHDADTAEEVKHYFRNRARQLLHTGYRLISFQEIEEGVIAWWNHYTTAQTGHEGYFSIFIYPQHRGKGAYYKIWESIYSQSRARVLTLLDCGIVKYLIYKNIPYTCEGVLMDSIPYRLISRSYGNSKATRSGVFLMNHIDEGLGILTNFGTETNIPACLGYCLHPLVQGDENLQSNFDYLDFAPALNIILAMEYRHIANGYLSTRKINSLDEIKLSPLQDVTKMLVADKIQNYKDFKTFHYLTHPRSSELEEYFNNWFKKLEVTHEHYENCARMINRIDEVN